MELFPDVWVNKCIESSTVKIGPIDPRSQLRTGSCVFVQAN